MRNEEKTYAQLLKEHNVIVSIGEGTLGQVSITYEGRTIEVEKLFWSRETPGFSTEDVIEEIFDFVEMVDPARWPKGEDLLDAFTSYAHQIDCITEALLPIAKESFRLQQIRLQQIEYVLGADLYQEFALAYNSDGEEGDEDHAQ